MSRRTSKRHGAFFHRDSGGKHEQSLEQYVCWVTQECNKRDLQFDGSIQSIKRMINSGQCESGDIYLDYEVKGDQLYRPGLSALRERAKCDPNLSHIFSVRSDRFARPKSPAEGMAIEEELRRCGKVIVYTDRELKALGVGDRIDVGENIQSLILFDKAGVELRELAAKVIQAQIALAKKGLSTGGRAPFGFERYLANSQYQVVQKLEDGMSVRHAGCHVVFLPGPNADYECALEIRDMLRVHPATHIAQILNQRGVPSPDALRVRTDGGVTHEVSGLWNPTTITNIGRNPLFAGITRYGLRSMGGHLRFSPEGPRKLISSDVIPGSDAPKVIRNAEECQVRSKAHFEPAVTMERHLELQDILNQRAGTQRGKPRSRGENPNPLGARVFDCECGWPMYRVARKDGYKYVCGLYQQSCASACEHNTVDGPDAVEFSLSCLQQVLLLRPDVIDRIKQKVTSAIQKANATSNRNQKLADLENEKSKLKSDLKKVTRNMALAGSDEQRLAMQSVFDELTSKSSEVDELILTLNRRISKNPSNDTFAQVMRMVDDLPSLAHTSTGAPELAALFSRVNLRLFLRFRRVKLKKRTVNRIAGGVVTIGDVPPPVDLYAGRTSSAEVRAAHQGNISHDEEILSDEIAESSRNASRGDRI